MKLGFLFSVAVSVAGGLVAPAKEHRLEAHLDPLFESPGCWEITPATLGELFNARGFKTNPYFRWLTEDKARAIFVRRPYSNVTLDLALFGGAVPVEEVVVDFEKGKMLGLTISVLNRGDSGKLALAGFDKRLKLLGKKTSELLGVKPFSKVVRPTQGMLAAGWIWSSSKGMATIEHNPEAPGQVEYLRYRFAKRGAGGVYAAARQNRAGAAASLSELKSRVRRDRDGNVAIEGVPMVDQGDKGYCVVASAQRLFEYYGISCGQHQLAAEIAGSDPKKGTSGSRVSAELSRIDHQFKTRFESIGRGEMHKSVRRYIDSGVPLLWALSMGKVAEEPPLKGRSDASHMRMIIGYNDKTNRFIFTDSWGAGHEFKTIDASDATSVTLGLFVLKPTVH